jgi:valyl-tRNA synthetase
MIMMGLELMGDVPFRDVIIHPTVLATDGRRMSKSLGTGVDPLELIADYGADATRFGLAYMSSVQDVRFSAERIEMGRNFANKIWNASRLILQGADPAAGSAPDGPRVELATAADRWIFSRLAAVAAEAAALYDAYEFDDVARVLYRFVWNEVCDWYLEIAKSRLYSESQTERLQVSGNLLVLLESVMTLLHPLMPFVTEEIYGYLPQVRAGLRPASLFDARYPEARLEWEDPAAEAAMDSFMAVVAGLRSAREELGLSRDVVGRVTIAASTPEAANAIVGLPGAFRQLCGCEIAEVVGEGQQPTGRFVSIEGPAVRAMLELEGLVDVEREAARLVGKAHKVHSEAAKARAKLDNAGFVAKAPENVAGERASYALPRRRWRARLQYQERVGGRLLLPGEEDR